MTSLALPQWSKAVARGLAARVYHATGAFDTRVRGRVAILTYHRVLPPAELHRHYVQPGMYVRADVFETQMRFVKEHFDLLSLSELLARWQHGGLDANRAYCAVTFDDGWLDNYRYAYPVLRRLRIPATIFLVTGFVGTDQWFWPDRLAYALVCRRLRAGAASARAQLELEIESAIERWKRMRRTDIEQELEQLRWSVGARWPRERMVVNWAEVEEMSSSGISFGSHSVSHAILAREDAGMAWREIHGSLHELRQRRINHVPVFCYPNGEHSENLICQVQAAGYQAAVASIPGCEGLKPSGLFTLRRIAVHNDVSDTVPLFSFHLAGIERRLFGAAPS